MKSFQSNNILIKLADTLEERQKVYRLRYLELVLEYNKDNHDGTDKDEYDDVCDHLIAIDTNTNEVVGTYRFILKEHLQNKKFLLEKEYDITNLYKYNLLEVGRAVVKKEYRDGIVINLLWKGVIQYAISKNVEYMMGTVSFHGVDPSPYYDSFAYLYYNHLSSKEVLAYALKDGYVDMSIKKEYDKDEALKVMPPLIKGYLRLGSTIANGAYIDKSFNCIDVLAILKIKEINPRYLKRYLDK